MKVIAPWVIIRQCHLPTHPRRAALTSNSDQIVPHVQQEFQALVADVTGADARAQTAYTVALPLFRRRLAVGAALVRLCFVRRAAVQPPGPGLAPDGTPRRYHEQRLTTDDAVCGNVRCGRHDCTASGQAGICPLAAELSVPARCDAALCGEWLTSGTTDGSSRESRTVLERIRGLSRSIQALEASVAEAAGEVTAVDDQPAQPPAPAPDATILVVQAAGTGGPMVQPAPAAPPGRLGKGQKRGKQKEAVVTGLSPIAP